MITIPLWLEQSLAALLYRTFLPRSAATGEAPPAIAILAVSSERRIRWRGMLHHLVFVVFLNFCYTDIDGLGRFLWKNIHIDDSLMMLSHQLNQLLNSPYNSN